MVRPTWFGPKVDGVEHFGTQLAQLNQKLRPKQAAKLEAAKVRETSLYSIFPVLSAYSRQSSRGLWTSFSDV